MSDLGVLGVGNSVAPNLWQSAPNGALQTIDAASDASFGHVDNNQTNVYDQGWALANMPDFFANMVTLEIQLRYAWGSTPTNTNWPLLAARVMNGATVLAASSSGGGWQTVASSITTTTPTNSAVINFAYVNTTADEATWNGAVVEIRIERNRSKGGSTAQQRVFACSVTGTYEPANTPPNTPVITNPSASAVIGGTVSLEATVSDPDGDNVRAVWELWDDTSLIEEIPENPTVVTSGTTHTTSWDSASIADGDYFFRVWAVDELGSTSDDYATQAVSKSSITTPVITQPAEPTTVGQTVSIEAITTAGDGGDVKIAWELWDRKNFSDSGAVLSSFSPPSTGSGWGLAWDGTNLWHTDSSAEVIYKMDKLGNLLDSYSLSGLTPRALTWDGVNLWVAGGSAGTGLIHKIDPSDGSVLDSIPWPGSETPRGLTWDGTNLWCFDTGDRRFYEVDPFDGTVLDSIWLNISAIYGLAWKDGLLYACRLNGIFQMKPNGEILGVLSRSNTTLGIAWETDDVLWIMESASSGSGDVYSLEIIGPSLVSEIPENPTLAPSGTVHATSWDTSSHAEDEYELRAFGVDSSELRSDGYDSVIINITYDILPEKPQILAPSELSVVSSGESLEANVSSSELRDVRAIWELRYVTDEEVGYVHQFFDVIDSAANWGLAWDGTYFWHVNWSLETLYKIDPITESLVDSFALPSNCRGLAFGGGYLWINNFTTSLDGRIRKYDPIDVTFIEAIPFPNDERGAGLSWDEENGCLWGSSLDTTNIYKIDPSDGSIINTFAAPVSVGEIEWDGKCLWICGNRTITRWNPFTDTILQSVTMPGAIYDNPSYVSIIGLVWDKTHMWMLDRQRFHISRVEVFGINHVFDEVPHNLALVSSSSTHTTLWNPVDPPLPDVPDGTLFQLIAYAVDEFELRSSFFDAHLVDIEFVELFGGYFDVTDSTTVAWSGSTTRFGSFEATDSTIVVWTGSTTRFGSFEVTDAVTVTWDGIQPVVPLTGGTFTVTDVVTVEWVGSKPTSASFDVVDAVTVTWFGVHEAKGTYPVSASDTIDWSGSRTSAGTFSISDVATVEWTGELATSSVYEVADVATVAWTGLVATNSTFIISDVALVEWSASRSSFSTYGVLDVASVEWFGSAPSLAGASGHFAVTDSTSVAWTGSTTRVGSFEVTDAVTVVWEGTSPTSGFFAVGDVVEVTWLAVAFSEGVFSVADQTSIEWSGQRSSLAAYEVSDTVLVTWEGSTSSSAVFAISDVSSVSWVGNNGGSASTYTVTDTTTVGWAGAADVQGTFSIADIASVEWVAFAPAVDAAVGSFAVIDTTTIEWSGTKTTTSAFEVNDVAAVSWEGATSPVGGYEITVTDDVSWSGHAPVVGEAVGAFAVTDITGIEWSGASSVSGVFEVTSVETVVWSGSKTTSSSYEVTATDSVTWTGSAPIVAEASGAFAVDDAAPVGWVGASPSTAAFDVSSIEAVGWDGARASVAIVPVDDRVTVAWDGAGATLGLAAIRIDISGPARVQRPVSGPARVQRPVNGPDVSRGDVDGVGNRRRVSGPAI